MMPTINDIHNAIDSAIDGDVTDASQNPNYYAARGGQYNDMSAQARADAIDAMRTDPGTLGKLGQALYAEMPTAPFNQGMVKGVGSSGRGAPSPGLASGLPARMLQGTTYANTADNDDTDEENAGKALNSPTTGDPRDDVGDGRHPDFPPNIRGDAYGASGPSPDAASTKTPTDANDQYILQDQKNATQATGGNTPVSRTPAMKQYLHALNPQVEGGKRYNDEYPNDDDAAYDLYGESKQLYDAPGGHAPLPPRRPKGL